jgi:hypothetical protein
MKQLELTQEEIIEVLQGRINKLEVELKEAKEGVEEAAVYQVNNGADVEMLGIFRQLKGKYDAQIYLEGFYHVGEEYCYPESYHFDLIVNGEPIELTYIPTTIYGEEIGWEKELHEVVDIPFTKKICLNLGF